MREPNEQWVRIDQAERYSIVFLLFLVGAVAAAVTVSPWWWLAVAAVIVLGITLAVIRRRYLGH